MKYRKFGKLPYQISALGFGCMRLPLRDNKIDIDEKESVRLIRYAIDRGVNYVDTAYPYHEGKSEIVTGKALGDGYRDKVKLATKLPLWAVTSPDDFDKFLNEQLKKLQTDHINFYLLHGINKKRWEDTVLKLGLLEKSETAIKDGRIGHIGFSFHDNYESFKLVVDGYERWDFCQIQYNYMDIENQAGTKGLRYAASKGLAVVVMEPLLGGKLATPSPDVRKVFERYYIKRSPAQWALQWIWNHPEVTSLLSGMNSMEQLDENLQAAETLSTEPLSPEDLKLIERIRSAFLKRTAVPCTKCDYCMPCPKGVNIPWILELYNNGIIYSDMPGSRFAYGRFVPEAQRANLCNQCGQCEEKCPQGIKPGKLMSSIHEKLK